MELRDIEPKKDPKAGAQGGGPVTPITPIISSFKNGHGFARFTLGNVVTILITIASVLYGMGRISERVEVLAAQSKSMDSKLDAIDRAGTSKGNAARELLDHRVLEDERRITSNEASLSVIVPDLREIKTKVDLIANALDADMKAGKR